MSGGTWEYKDYLMEMIADDIEGELDENEYNRETKKYMHEAIKQLRKARIYAHRLDYLFSGDDDEDNFVRRLKKELKEFDGNMNCNGCNHLETILDMFSIDGDQEYKCCFYNVFVNPDNSLCGGEHKKTKEEK